MAKLSVLLIMLFGMVAPLQAQGPVYGPVVMVTSTVILKQNGRLPYIATFQGAAALVDAPDGIAYVAMPALFADPQVLLDEVLQCQREGCEGSVPLPENERFQSGSMELSTKLHFPSGLQEFRLTVEGISTSELEADPSVFDDYAMVLEEEALCIAAADDSIALFIPTFLRKGGRADVFIVSEQLVAEMVVVFPGVEGYWSVGGTLLTSGSVALIETKPYPYFLGAPIVTPELEFGGMVIGGAENSLWLELVKPAQISDLMAVATEDNFCGVYAAAEAQLE